MAKRFITPFAEAGDRATMPDVPVGTDSNYQTGYPSQYEEDPVVNPLTAKFVERDKSNQLYNDITANLKEWQEHTFPAFITSAVNGGVPFSYKKNSIVTLGGVDYASSVDGNEDVPPSSKWEVFSTSLIKDLSQTYDFSTVSLMKSSTVLLPVGKKVETKGYYSAGGGGAASYLIKTAAQAAIDGDVIDTWGNHTLADGKVAIVQGAITTAKYGAVGTSDGTAASQAAVNEAFRVGTLTSTVTEVTHEGLTIIDAALGSSTNPSLAIKNFTKLKGSGTFKAKDASYTTGNPPIIGNDQSINGATEIHIDGIKVDANATNNVSTVAGAISILFGRPVGPSGGPGEQGVFKGSIKNIEFIDTSFIGAQVKDKSSQIIISDILNNGGHFAVQASNSKQVDISSIISANTVNNAVDVFGNNGDKFNLSGKTGTYTRGETVTGGTSGATARLLEDNGASIQMDTIVGTFTPTETLTGGASGATATFDSKEFTKGNFSGSVRGVHANGCLTGVFLESVSDVPVSDCNIKNATGNGLIINRINSITSGNRVTNFTVENAAEAGVLFSGEVTDNEVELTADGCADGAHFNGSSFNTVKGKTKNCTNGARLEGTGNKNQILLKTINTATVGVDVGANQSGTKVEVGDFIATTTRLVDAGTDTRYLSPEAGNIVDVSGAGNIAPNLDAGNSFITKTVTVSTPIFIDGPSGTKVAGSTRLTLMLKQDGTGGHAITFNAIYKIKTAASTVANRRSHYEFLWTGTFFESISEVIDF